MTDLFVHLWGGIVGSLTPLNVMMLFVGCILGLLVGALPGLGSVNGVAILLPITFIVPPETAIIFLCAIYYGAMYGGAISSITLGIPGASTAVATVFDGRPMAQAGQADRALVTAAAASFIGGTIATIMLTLFAPPLAAFALRFGPPEIFALMMLAFATFVGLGGDDIPKTIFSIVIGLVLATIGLDVITGRPRFIFFDISGFYHGVHFLVLAIGIYGIGEMLWTLDQTKSAVQVEKVDTSIGSMFRNLLRVRQFAGVATMGSFLGFFVGMLPAAGATPAALMSYGMAKAFSNEPETFGKGNPKGIAAPESANNAASCGSLLPMITLGIPGSPTTAILLGGMIIWGLRPGPLLFTEHPEFVWDLIGSLYLANIVSLIANIALIPVFARILTIRFSILAPVIFILSVVGGYAPLQTVFDVWLMFLFGVVGYALRKLDYPVAPAVLAIVLGPLAEESFRQSLLLRQGDILIFFQRPLSAMFMAIALFLFVYPIVMMNLRARRRRAAAAAGKGEAGQEAQG